MSAESGYRNEEAANNYSHSSYYVSSMPTNTTKPVQEKEESGQLVSMPTPTNQSKETRLSRTERWNLCCLLFAWACNICTLTIVAGTSAVVVLSVGGASSVAPIALGMFFLGMSIVSLTLTPWLFDRYGRKMGFLTGATIGLVGTALGIISIIIRSPAMVILATLPLGAGTGIEMYLRFAAVEVVPSSHSAFAVTLVLSGGCIAAFIGPESANALKNSFGDDLIHLGVFLMTGIFQIMNALFISRVQFPEKEHKQNHQSKHYSINAGTGNESPTPVTEDNRAKTETRADDNPNHDANYKDQDDDNDKATFTLSYDVFCKLLNSRHFVISLLVASLSWAIMAMPMSLGRVAMNQVGYTNRQSLTVIELHFLGMFSPGLISGKFIQKYGTVKAIWVAIVCFALGICFDLMSKENTDGNDKNKAIYMITWILGLVLLGCGWNFGFSAAAVKLTRVYEDDEKNDQNLVQGPSSASPTNIDPISSFVGTSTSSPVPNAPSGNNPVPRFTKTNVQAGNEFIMFLLSGAGIVCSGYIYEAGAASDVYSVPSPLDGWKTLNYVCLGLTGLLILIMVYSALIVKRSPLGQRNKTSGMSENNCGNRKGFSDPAITKEEDLCKV